MATDIKSDSRPRMRPRSLSLPDDLVEQFNHRAAAADRSLSAEVREAMRAALRGEDR